MKNLITTIFILITLTGLVQENNYQLTNKKQHYNLEYQQNTSVEFDNGNNVALTKTVSFEFEISGNNSSDSLVGEISILKINGEVAAPQGQQKIDTRNLNNKVFNFSVPKNGGAIKVTGKNSGLMLGGDLGGIMPLEYLLSYQFIELPLENMKAGLKWESALTRDQIEGVAPLKVDLNLKHVVLKKEKVDGISCFKIETSINSATKANVRQHGTDLVYDGKSTAQVIWYIDINKGRIIKLKAIENSIGTLGEATLKQETTFELTMPK